MDMPTVQSVMKDICSGKFNFTEEDERDWNAQPTGRKYYVGRPKPGSDLAYNVQWKPSEGKLSWWVVADASQNASFTGEVANWDAPLYQAIEQSLAGLSNAQPSSEC